MGKGGHGGCAHDGHYSDFWTELTFYTDIVTTFSSTGYSLGEMVDIFASDMLGAEQTAIELSLPAIILGGILGFFAAWGKGTIHKIRNKNSQHDESNVISTSPKQSPGNHNNGEAYNSQQIPHSSTLPPIKYWNDLALKGDYLAHTTGFASSFTFLYNLLFASSSVSDKLCMQAIALLIGITAAHGDTRSCGKNTDPNSNTRLDDWAANWTTFIDAIAELSSSLYWAADLFDTFANLILMSFYNSGPVGIAMLFGTPTGFSWPALIFGAVIGVMALGGVICHRVLMKDDDGKGNKLPKGAKITLTTAQGFFLAGDAISHTTETSAPLNFIFELASKTTTMPNWASALIKCTSTFFGIASARSEVRSCKNAMLGKNYRKQQKL